ncbi:Uncharacterised protein [Salmonella enterica subsp. salamae]|uniref:Uncharacterized protein n=1 Tax=Salmonella enterica TaxID=28901 RepID=A0A379R2E8_SALER|nr:Uncharacterised protein [Salmonella enterica]SUI20915.1 Uncharacterised protein [Salmonella enterica subsp. salamae]VEA61834.1 Uncharacterised protein [Salmonella enterica subsp. salamae]
MAVINALLHYQTQRRLRAAFWEEIWSPKIKFTVVVFVNLYNSYIIVVFFSNWR